VPRAFSRRERRKRRGQLPAASCQRCVRQLYWAVDAVILCCISLCIPLHHSRLSCTTLAHTFCLQFLQLSHIANHIHLVSQKQRPFDRTNALSSLPRLFAETDGSSPCRVKTLFPSAHSSSLAPCTGARAHLRHTPKNPVSWRSNRTGFAPYSLAYHTPRQLRASVGVDRPSSELTRKPSSVSDDCRHPTSS
jgi:hypothetical protein